MKVFPKGFQIQNIFGKIMIPIIFIFLSYGLNRQVIQSLNILGHRNKVYLNGIIAKKWEVRKKWGRKDYFLVVRDTGKNVNYTFQVNGNVYEPAFVLVPFSKQFDVGLFNILYSKEN